MDWIGLNWLVQRDGVCQYILSQFTRKTISTDKTAITITSTITSTTIVNAVVRNDKYIVVRVHVHVWHFSSCVCVSMLAATMVTIRFLCFLSDQFTCLSV